MTRDLAEKTTPTILSIQVISDAWRTLKANFWSIVGVHLIYALLSSTTKIPYLGILASILLLPPLTVGFYGYCLAQVRNQSPEVRDIFSGFKGFKIFGKSIGAFFLFGLLVALGLLFFIIPGYFLFFAFSLTFFFVLDKGMGPWEAMKASFDATNGYRWRIMIISVLCGLINILGVLCLGIGILVTAPIQFLAMASLYERITARKVTEFQRQQSKAEIIIGSLAMIISLLILMATIGFLRKKATFPLLRPRIEGSQDKRKRAGVRDKIEFEILATRLFVYDSQEKRDPFVPLAGLEEGSKFAWLTLEGILWDPQSPLAIINDNIVGKGDKIEGAEVVEIKEDRVILRYGKEQSILRLK